MCAMPAWAASTGTFANRVPGDHMVLYTTGGFSDLAMSKCGALHLDVSDHVSLQ